MTNKTKVFAEASWPSHSTFEECVELAKEHLARLKKEQPDVTWEIWIDSFKFSEEELEDM